MHIVEYTTDVHIVVRAKLAILVCNCAFLIDGPRGEVLGSCCDECVFILPGGVADWVLRAFLFADHCVRGCVVDRYVVVVRGVYDGEAGA